jgi:hypothetical protein
MRIAGYVAAALLLVICDTPGPDAAAGSLRYGVEVVSGRMDVSKVAAGAAESMFLDMFAYNSTVTTAGLLLSSSQLHCTADGWMLSPPQRYTVSFVLIRHNVSEAAALALLPSVQKSGQSADVQGGLVQEAWIGGSSGEDSGGKQMPFLEQVCLGGQQKGNATSGSADDDVVVMVVQGSSVGAAAPSGW